MSRMTLDRLTVVEDGEISLYGATDGELEAAIEIHDARAWTALLREGSIGLGRGYFEGWWDSDDPTTVVRIIIRNIEPVDELRNQFTEATSWLTNRLRRLHPSRAANLRRRNREDIASHYDLGNEFFQLFLDETLTYSSAIFPSAEAALAEGSAYKYDRLLSKIGVQSGHRLLEIGTGWGGFALRAADTTGCSVTTTTISDEQLKEARRRVAVAGRSDSVELLNRDWRDLEGQFDRIVSIEMIEAVDWLDYDHYFRTIESCLVPDGLVAIQAICVPDRRYERTKNTEDFIRRFVFPGGFLPSLGAIGRSVSSATRLQMVDVEDLSAHYAETLRRWRLRFDEREEEVQALGLDQRFIRLWRFYLAYCEAGFLERHCTVNQIILAGRRWRPNDLSLRP
jgi:cyclopropane-fatty-acyl-phospholipid synthase